MSAEKLDGKKVIKMMHDTYNDKWYTNLTFTQQTIFYRNGKKAGEQTWYEAKKLPLGLIIKIGSKDSGNGSLYAGDNHYRFQNGELVSTKEETNELLDLGSMVYKIPPKKTIKRLSKHGFDLSKAYESTFNGMDVYVVGKNNEQEDAPYFIIDKDKLLMHKLVRDLDGNDLEVEFKNYESIGNGWIAPYVTITVNGSLYMEEKYNDIMIPENLSDDIFDPSNFASAKW